MTYTKAERIEMIIEFAKKVLQYPKGSRGYDPVDKLRLKGAIEKYENLCDHGINQLKPHTVSFFEGPYQFKQETTNLNITEDYIQMVLAKQYEYRATTEDLWAEVTINGECERYVFDYNEGLKKIIKTKPPQVQVDAQGPDADDVFNNAVTYVQQMHCTGDAAARLGMPYMILGDVAELIKITTGREVDWKVLDLNLVK